MTLWYTAMLLGIVVVIAVFSYSMLRRSLVGDIDIELAVVGQLVRDAGVGVAERPESQLREILGHEFQAFFFRVVGPGGDPEGAAAGAREGSLPLSARAESRARRGEATFETVVLAGADRVRLLTMPVTRAPDSPRFIQVGIELDRIDRALVGYLQTLAILGPLGLGLSAAGGAWLARSALRPVQLMSRAARRITAEDLSRRLPRQGTRDELDHLADTLNALFARLEEAFGDVQRFAADAAHQLRTPLTALRGGIEVALRADRDPETYRDVLSSSLEEVDRVIRLAEGLLLFSRVRRGRRAPRQPVDLERLLIEVFDVAARLAKVRGVSVQLSSVEPLTVHGEAATLWGAVMNLLENAIRYTPAGGKVEVALERDGADAVLHVHDTGVGIDSADIDRIFEPFVRLDSAPACDRGGAGLGLSIVRAIVTAHGGTLSVQSAHGAGSTFTMRLPMARGLAVPGAKRPVA